ncbi:hypothetical protein [Arthrobacter sp. NPDC057013]|uniref:hypothetical protein n=1 Tax=Arthrobacter sp. NPDC057013 TaxID=3345999 RepID=UPI0036327EED
MPKPAGIELQVFCLNSSATDFSDITRDNRDSVGLRHRDDNAELPSTGPERDGAEVSTLTETNICRPKVQQRPLDMSP